MKQTKIIIVVGAAFVLLGVLGPWLTRHDQRSVSHVAQLPEARLKTYGGEGVNISEYRGKILLVNVWASWCPFCREEFRYFKKLKAQFGDGITIIAVNRAESLETAQQYSNSLEADGIIFLLDPADSFYQKIGGFSMPETMLVDPAGVILDHRRGPVNLAALQREVQEVLRQK